MVKSQNVLYQTIYSDLRAKLLSGELPVGSRILPESELTKYYNASTNTVRKAIQMLCDEGYLHKQRPVGTFVIGRPAGESSQGSAGVPVRQDSHTLRIGVLVPDVQVVLPDGSEIKHWQIYLRRLKGIFAEASRNNATVLMHEKTDVCNWSNYDGVIVIRWGDLYHEEVFQQVSSTLTQQKVPFVVISDYMPRMAAKWWMADNLELEFYRAFRFLAQNGSKSILYVGPEWVMEKNPRIMALAQGSADFGFSYEILNNEDPDLATGYQVIRNFCAGDLNKLKKFDTIFCSTDLQALGVMKFLLENGIRIPDDINLMGCDNIQEAELAAVPLTTFEFSGSYTGELAMSLLLKAIANPDADGETVSGRGKILVRESVKILKNPLF